MKNDSVRNGSLALVGLAALTVYILACTSFSPDDRKVLFPSFDPLTGRIGIAEYDRETARSRMLFVPLAYPDETNDPPTPLLRAQWLGNGRQILVSWAYDEDRLDLAVVPVVGEGAVRLFAIPAEDPGEKMIVPVAVAGREAFLHGDETLIRLNLANGTQTRHALSETDKEFRVYPGPDGESVFYLLELDEPKRMTFGRLDPATFARTPVVTFTNDLVDGSFFTYDRRGQRVALVEHAGAEQRLVVLESGKPPLTRILSGATATRYGNAIFLERADLILASFMRRNPGTNTAAFGLVEIPIRNGSVRETVLIRNTEATDEMAAFLFQVGVSHDGKTAAVSSAYLACLGEDLKADDCGLFLVDLSDAKRKVTRVPIALPARLPQAIK